MARGRSRFDEFMSVGKSVAGAVMAHRGTSPEQLKAKKEEERAARDEELLGLKREAGERGKAQELRAAGKAGPTMLHNQAFMAAYDPSLPPEERKANMPTYNIINKGMRIHTEATKIARNRIPDFDKGIADRSITPKTYKVPVSPGIIRLINNQIKISADEGGYLQKSQDNHFKNWIDNELGGAIQTDQKKLIGTLEQEGTFALKENYKLIAEKLWESRAYQDYKVPKDISVAGYESTQQVGKRIMKIKHEPGKKDKQKPPESPGKDGKYSAGIEAKIKKTIKDQKFTREQVVKALRAAGKVK